MKVLLANSVTRSGGAALAMKRVGDALQARGVEVYLATLDSPGWSQWPPDPDSICRKPRLQIISERLPLLRYPAQWKTLHSLSFSGAVRWSDSSRRINAVRADVVNLHWVNYGFVSPEGLARIDAPVAWTAHDMWPFTGGCHHSDACEGYQRQCGCCPLLGGKSAADLSNRVMRRKTRSWTDKNIRLICPSNWLAQRAKHSSLFSSRPVSVIPNPLDTALFSPGERGAARSRLGLPPTAVLILFGTANGIHVKAKGFHFLDQALKRMTRTMSAAAKPHLVLVGSEACNSDQIQSGVPVHVMGRLTPAQMVDVYRAANVFVLPSLHENLPNMIAESLACGTPAVAFDIGGIGDLVSHLQSGYLAKPFDLDDLEAGISHCLDSTNAAMGEAGRIHIAQTLSPTAIADRYIDEFSAAIRSGR